jgi:tripartite-type tricarboxylate transporter receptor subunit TctC
MEKRIRDRMTKQVVALCAAMAVTAFAQAQTAPAASASAARAGTFPVKPVRFIVPYLAGGTADVLSRALGQKLGDAFGQQVVIDLRPGAGGNLGTELAAKSAPDGHTIVLATVGPFATNVTLYAGRMAFDPARDFEPVSLIARSPLVFVTHPSIPARNIAELVRLARSRLGQLSYATPGNGTANHLVMEMFKSTTGTDILHIPFKGTAQSLVALIGGEIELLVGQIPSTRAQLAAGRVRALALSGTRRSSALPQVPTFAEAGVAGLEATSWYGVAAPANTPRDIVGRLHGEIAKALASPDVRSRYQTEGAEAESSTPAEYAAFIREEVVRWGKAVRDSRTKLE